jgi:hypothetical protein
VAIRESKYYFIRTFLIKELAKLYNEFQSIEAITGFLIKVYAEGGALGVLVTIRAYIKKAIQLLSVSFLGVTILV